MSIKRFLSITAAAAMLTLPAIPAFAVGSIGGGFYTSGGSGVSANGGGVILGTNASVPVLPASIGITGFAPIARGGGYAVTVDGAFAAGAGNALGVGYGVGQFGAAHSGGTLTAFVDHSIAPLTSIEVRGYHTTGAGGGTAGIVALKLSL